MKCLLQHWRIGESSILGDESLI